MTGFTRLIPALFCLLLVAACGSSGGSKISDTQVQKLVLQDRDLPKAFGSFADGATMSLDVQGTPRRDLARYGRKAGWVARYHRSGSPSTPGPLVVASMVDVFDSAGGAKKDFAAYVVELDRQSSRGAHPIDLPQLGDAAVGVTSLQASSNPVRTYVIAWRERNATASLTAMGFDRRLSLAGVVALARRQEKRMQSAG
jgi:hypothetical protein